MEKAVSEESRGEKILRNDRDAYACVLQWTVSQQAEKEEPLGLRLVWVNSAQRVSSLRSFWTGPIGRVRA